MTSQGQSGVIETPQNPDAQRSDAVEEAYRLVNKATKREVLDGFHIRGMKKWDGLVVAVDGDYVIVELVPHEAGPRLMAELPLDQFPEDEHPVIGDVLYLTVRRVRGPGGTISTTQAIRLRRLGVWTEDEAARHKEAAKSELLELLKFIEK